MTDVGRQREVNEDRLHVDASRGIFIVVDGVGGQAAGGRAADIAVSVLRAGLERQTGTLSERVQQAVIGANNEIHAAAAQRPEWRGMACVLTVLAIENGRAVIGHVGDTRLYLIRGGAITKLTPDHSPVGEREDAHELSEAEAMRHPRRNEVYRDVGSATHQVGDSNFLFLHEVEVPPDAAWLLCSDGLTDLVPLDHIRAMIDAHRGTPELVVQTLVQAANDAGGKDNVTVVYAEGERVAAAHEPAGVATRQLPGARKPARSGRGFVAVLVLLAVLAGAGWYGWRQGWFGEKSMSEVLAPQSVSAIVVRPAESIAAAIERAQPGTDVVVEPGEYRERLTLKDNVRVISREPRGAVLRLPAGAAETDAAVVAAGTTGAELSGFRIVGDAATPLGVGIITREANVRVVDVEISGATTAALDIGPGAGLSVIASDIHDNAGAAVIIRAGGSPRIVHSVFVRNGSPDRVVSPFIVEPGARPELSRNVFPDLEATRISGVDDVTRAGLTADNWFIVARLVPAARSSSRGSARGR